MVSCAAPGDQGLPGQDIHKKGFMGLYTDTAASVPYLIGSHCPQQVSTQTSFLSLAGGLLLSPLHHPIVTRDFGKGFAGESAMLGTRDYSSLLAVPSALDFYAALGGDAVVVARNSALAWSA